MNKIGRNFYNEIAEKLRRKEDLTNEDFFKIFYLTIMYGKKKNEKTSWEKMEQPKALNISITKQYKRGG